MTARVSSDNPARDVGANSTEMALNGRTGAVSAEAAGRMRDDAGVTGPKAMHTVQLSTAQEGDSLVVRGTLPRVDISQQPSLGTRAWGWVTGGLDAAGQSLRGAATYTLHEITQHPGRSAVTVGGGLVVGTALIAAAPVAATLGAGATTVALIETGVTGLFAWGTASLARKAGRAFQQSSGDLDVLVHPNQHSAQELESARQNVREVMGPATLEAAAATVGAVGTIYSGGRVVAAMRSTLSGRSVPAGAITPGTTPGRLEPRAESDAGAPVPPNGDGSPAQIAGAGDGSSPPTSETRSLPGGDQSPASTSRTDGVGSLTEPRPDTRLGLPHVVIGGAGGSMEPSDGERQLTGTAVDRTNARTETGQLSHEDAVRQARLKDNATQNDITGRPLSDGNVARISEEFKPLSVDAISHARFSAERDLARYHGETGGAFFQLQSSNLSEAQYNRVLNVFSEVREVLYARDGQHIYDAHSEYPHTIGELGEGLASAARNGLTSTETQNALLAAMLSDVAKWPGSDGNFFTHHLDGALAANVILSRYIGEGFSATDLQAVQHAIMEHQIGPPSIMSKFYTERIRKALQREGPISAENEMRIENIGRMMADPLHAPVEADSQGGYRVQFTPEERSLLRDHVAKGAENWHVPHPNNPWNKVSRNLLEADSFDNYFVRLNRNDIPISAPSKIASLEGPHTGEHQTLESAINRLRQNAQDTLDSGLITPASRDEALARIRVQDRVYAQAKETVASWIRLHLGDESMMYMNSAAWQRYVSREQPQSLDDFPYFSRPLQPPSKGAPEAVKQAYYKDLSIAGQVHDYFVQVLQAYRYTDRR